MEKKPFKELRGNRVMLLVPPIPESKIQLTPEAKRAVVEEQKAKLRKLKVYAVPPDSFFGIKEGDEVMVDSYKLAMAEYIELSPEITVIIVNPLDVCLVW